MFRILSKSALLSFLLSIAALSAWSTPAQAAIDTVYYDCVNNDPALNLTASSNCLAGVSVQIFRIRINNAPSGFDPQYGDAWVAIPNTPTTTRISNKLLLFLPGTNTGSTADDGNVPYYSYLAERAAYLGYGAAIILPYPNTMLVGNTCGTVAYSDFDATNMDGCYTNTRGEAVYGQNTSYKRGQPSYNVAATTIGSVPWQHISVANSVINRLTLLLSTLATDQPLGRPPEYWAQFISTNQPDSPYDNQAYSYSDNGTPYKGTGPDNGAYPNWSSINIGGHSQGGAVAAFLMSTIPATIPRGVLFSAPQDSYTMNNAVTPAAWIRQSSVGPRLWVMRHGPSTTTSDEGTLGDAVETNWNAFGGGQSPVPGTDVILNDPCLINGGTDGAPTFTECSSLTGMTSAHRYLLTAPVYSGQTYASLNNHDSTAVNSLLTNGLTARKIFGNICSTGSSCSVLNPNEAYVYDQMLVPH